MFNFFKKKRAVISNQNIPHVARGTQIQYVPNLIDNLVNDHEQLLNLYGEIKKSFDNNKYKQVTKKLKKFKMVFTDHLLTENIKLYIYLSHEFSTDELNSDLIKGFRSEMNQISKVVMAFLKRYETLGVDKALAEKFGNELDTIGAALVERIEREEETLYPLYMMPFTPGETARFL